MYNSDSKELKIKPEFKNLIRPLHRQEYLQLEENMLRDGCLDPIIVWNGFIVDGHNRYAICTKHNIPFKTIEMKFNTKEDVIAWICANQLGRRNISNETRKFLIGMQYETEKVIQGRANPLSSYNEGNDLVDETAVRSPNTPSNRKTAKRIGDENNISAASVQKYAAYTRAIEEIGKKESEIVPKILSGRYKISHENVVKMSEMSSDELKHVNRRLNRSKSPYLKYSRSRAVLNDGDPVKNTPSIKQMPAFDPDAEVTELTLTMPSWISSIKRTRANANLDIISDAAKSKLIEALLNMKNTVNELLTILEEEN